MIDGSEAAHGYHGPFEILYRVGNVKDLALLLNLKFAVVFAQALQHFDLLVEDLNQERHEYILVVGDGIAFAIAARRARVPHDHDKIVFLDASH